MKDSQRKAMFAKKTNVKTNEGRTIDELRKAKSTGGIIEVHQKTPFGERHMTQFLKSTHWNKLPEHQKELLLDTLGLENDYSRGQIAKMPHNKLGKFWINKLAEHGVTA